MLISWFLRKLHQIGAPAEQSRRFGAPYVFSLSFHAADLSRFATDAI